MCLWLIYVSWLGFFVDVNLFKANNKKAAELSKDSNTLLRNINGALDSSLSSKDGLADEDSNLMVKLKFLTYKVLCYCFQLLLWLGSLVNFLRYEYYAVYLGLVTFMLNLVIKFCNGTNMLMVVRSCYFLWISLWHFSMDSLSFSRFFILAHGRGLQLYRFNLLNMFFLRIFLYFYLTDKDIFNSEWPVHPLQRWPICV